MKGIIYKYTFPDGKVYIGQTRRHPEKRKHEHLDESTGPTNSGFWEAYKKFGTYEYEELWQIECEDEDELVWKLNIAETHFIQQYQADNPNCGYNKKSYGTVATKTNAVLQKKYNEYLDGLLEVRLKEYEDAINKVWYTKKPLTQEEKYLLKTKYREQNGWQKYIDKFDFDHLSKNKDIEFEVEEGLGIIRSFIIQEADEEARQYIAENYVQILEDERDKNTIVQIDKAGNVVKEFYSFNEICQAFNVPRADNVKNVLKGKQKSAYGYYWKYKKDA